MKVFYRTRNVIEEMEYALEGDRPVDYFLLTEPEYEQYIRLAGLNESSDEKEYREYKGVRIVTA